ncbi:MAG TPA: helix-turn-helix domain-containing protein [Solirubrobacterales bacterium]|nr:helix-turn-helix domain-containing protein [Solirubrobacterales bacterium]
MKRRTESQARSVLRERLAARRGEIEAATLARVGSIGESDEHKDPTYAAGLRTAVLAALDYALEAIGQNSEQSSPVPVALLAQARLAARRGVSLDTVLRRYFAGYSLLGYFLVEEASEDGLSGPALQRLVGNQAGTFDRLLAAVGEEHRREAEARRMGSGRRQVEQIERLLAGEMVDAAALDYELGAHHLAIVASGAEAELAIRELSAPLDRRLLIASPGEGEFWAWLGGRLAFEPGQIDRLIAALAEGAPCAAFAIGEPGQGQEGWRLSHRQALAALPVAERGTRSAVRYRDVPLAAAVIRDELLATSLRRLYLEPLRAEPDGGQAALATLRAYFASGRNVTSTAADLGVVRNTVMSRLRAIEDQLGRPPDSIGAALELALRLDEFDS